MRPARSPPRCRRAAYAVEPQPVTGLMGRRVAQPVTVLSGAIATVELVYDTGIRLPVSAS